MTIKELYEKRKAEFNDMRNQYIGILDALHHLVNSGLGDTVVPDETMVEPLPADHATDTPTETTVTPEVPTTTT